MVDFIVAYWDVILLIVVVLVAALYLAFRAEKSVIFKMLYSMVTEAEKEYGGGTGSLKLAAVIERVYAKLPALLRAFIPASTLQKWIEDVLTEAKKAWESNANIATYIGKENKE